MSHYSSFPQLLTVILAFLLFASPTHSAVSELNCEDGNCYNKPPEEAVECLSTIDTLNKKAAIYRENMEKALTSMDGGNLVEEIQCIGCTRSQEECPSECQAIIDSLFEFCTGVTLPDGYFYDPPNDEGSGAIEGEWNDEVVRQLVIAAGRCGCNPAASLTAAYSSFLLLLSSTLLFLG